MQEDAAAAVQKQRGVRNDFCAGRLPAVVVDEVARTHRHIGESGLDRASDLQCGQLRSAARQRKYPVDAAKRAVVFGRLRRQSRLLPPLRQRVLDARGAHHEARPALPPRLPDQQSADLGEVAGSRRIAKDGVALRVEQRIDAAVERRVILLELRQAQAGDRQRRLPRQMHGQVGLVHRRHRMHAHDRMAVDSIDLPVGRGAGKEVAEHAIPAQRRVACNDRHRTAGKALARQLDHAADIADARCAVEGRADLVMHDGGSQVDQSVQQLGQPLVHLAGRHAAAVTGNPDRVEAAEALQRLRRRRLEE